MLRITLDTRLENNELRRLLTTINSESDKRSLATQIVDMLNGVLVAGGYGWIVAGEYWIEEMISELQNSAEGAKGGGAGITLSKQEHYLSLGSYGDLSDGRITLYIRERSRS